MGWGSDAILAAFTRHTGSSISSLKSQHAHTHTNTDHHPPSNALFTLGIPLDEINSKAQTKEKKPNKIIKYNLVERGLGNVKVKGSTVKTSTQTNLL